jgi:hypothetical protein
VFPVVDASRSFGTLTHTGRCPVCGNAVKSSARRCTRCDVRYHSDCWSYSGGCAVYGCKAVPPAPRSDGLWDFPRSCDAIGQQLVGLGGGFTRDTLALALGTFFGLAFWETMDAHGGVFFLLWFALGMLYLLYWPAFRERGFPVTVLHAFFLGPLAYVVVPLEIPALFALTTGLVMVATGAAVRFYAWSPASARVAAAAGALCLAIFYHADGQPVRFWVDRTGPDNPIATAAWPSAPVVLASRTAVHAWRVGSQLERLHEIGLAGYRTVDEGRWAGDVGRRLDTLPKSGATRAVSAPLFTRDELEQLLRDPELGAALGFTRSDGKRERIIVIPWWGPRAPEVSAVVRQGERLRVIVDLPPVSLPYVTRGSDGARRFHRRVIAIPMDDDEIDVEYRAAGSWLLGRTAALRLSGYEPDSVPNVVKAEAVDLDADWMLRRLAPVVDLCRE